MSAYTLPSVSASTVSWMKVSTPVGSLLREIAERPGKCRAARLNHDAIDLADELVRTVGLDLEDVELRVQRVVRPRRELEGPPEDPVLDHDLLDLAQDVLLALQDAVVCNAGELDRVQEHLSGPVARRPEGADGLSGVGLLPAGDDLRVGLDARDVRSEVRHVRACGLEGRRVVR